MPKTIKLEELVEASSAENLWFAGQHYGRTPTPLEAVEYYLAHTARIHTFVVAPLFEDLEEVSGSDLFED